MEELYKVHTARSMDEIKAGLSTCELMPQNIMVATVDGDTFYVHDGRVPVRNHGLPTNKPVPGNTFEKRFRRDPPVRGIGAGDEPEGGYMQNCNVAPVQMMRGSPMSQGSRQAAVPVLRRRAGQSTSARNGDRAIARRQLDDARRGDRRGLFNTQV